MKIVVSYNKNKYKIVNNNITDIGSVKWLFWSD
jgi:hypothetical protein